MSNVTLSFGGRSFTVACAAGEEAHITALGRMVDAKLAAMGNAAGQSESRMLLFAVLLLADEVHDLKAKMPQPSLFSEPDKADRLASRLATLAERMENLATSLEG